MDVETQTHIMMLPLSELSDSLVSHIDCIITQGLVGRYQARTPIVLVFIRRLACTLSFVVEPAKLEIDTDTQGGETPIIITHLLLTVA